jgi:hypothetical protein
MRLGLGVFGDNTTVIPPDMTKDISLQQEVCTVAGGTWMNTPVPNSGCQVATGPSLPTYCNYIPFATSLFSECTLPTDPSQVADYSQYTVYKIGVQSGVDAATVAEAQAQKDAADSFNQGGLDDCNYLAASASPTLSNTFGPDLARMLTNPSASGCSGGYSPIAGWLLYAAMGLGAFLLVTTLTRK